ncbi:hypothetical protein GCM10012284_52890 [Mangrovihabitans endophyticus]|uniref:Uncharacterized protein n=1 Tax=Mangrovihabitans endophyticus TaxID=1751298 RepID=A0A8J3FR02_9ACTN|nr:hypothetical protein GCM10012284_52890 [Mangrovihabitans endophyticus]
MSAFAAVMLVGSAAACGDDQSPTHGPAEPSADASVPPDGSAARADLAALAAAAEDHRFAALYDYTAPGRDKRALVATVARDGSWRVDVAKGALGGTADVAIVSNSQGVFQCSLSSTANPVTPTCVRVADQGERVPAEYDPKIERVFRQWLDVFTDRQSALSVTATTPLKGSRGTCFSIDSISASLSAAVDVGIYCYAADGLLTAARVESGTVRLAADPAPAPATVPMPGPVVDGDAMGMASPPPPPPEPSASAASAPAA